MLNIKKDPYYFSVNIWNVCDSIFVISNTWDKSNKIVSDIILKELIGNPDCEYSCNFVIPVNRAKEFSEEKYYVTY